MHLVEDLLKLNRKKILKLFNGKVINFDNSRINLFEFEQINFSLQNLSTKSITVPKVQEIDTKILLSCFFDIENNKFDRFDCTERLVKEVKVELIKRLYKPIYIPLIVLFSCFLILYSKNQKNYKTQINLVFIATFFLLVYSEVSTQYSAISPNLTILYLIIPVIIFIIGYLFFTDWLRMFKIYQKYIIKNFLKKIFNISLIFLLLIFILSILEELKFFKDIEANFMFPYFLTFLNVPITLFEIFPFIFFISAQFFYDLLKKDELNLLKKNGLSNLKILKILFFLSFFIGVFNILIYYNFASKTKILLFRY